MSAEVQRELATLLGDNVDTLVDALELLYAERARAATAEQELAAAEAEIELLAKCQAFALWVSGLNGSNPMLRRRVSLDDIVKRAIAALINGDES